MKHLITNPQVNNPAR